MTIDDVFTLILIVSCFFAFVSGWLIGLLSLHV